MDGIQYTGAAIDFIQHEVGVARKSGTSYSYEYNLTDHLGNVRYTFYKNQNTGALTRVQSDDYYPFGLRKSTGSPVSLNNKYLYNGKELQEEFGQYDYGARLYDPVIGRWNVVDPLAESYQNLSPYNYADNNPVNNIDPNGKEVFYGQGIGGGDLYTGADAQALFGQLQSSQGNQDDKQKKKSETAEQKSQRLASEEAASLKSMNESMLKLNKFMLGFMEFKLFAEGFAETFPGKVKTSISKFVNKESVIQFGNPEIPNQVSHAIRHLEAAGLNVEKVKEAIITNLKPGSSYKVNVRITGTVNVNGVRIDYSGVKLHNGTINIGSIKPPR